MHSTIPAVLRRGQLSGRECQRLARRAREARRAVGPEPTGVAAMGEARR